MGGGASSTSAQVPAIPRGPETPAQPRDPGLTLTTSMPRDPENAGGLQCVAAGDAVATTKAALRRGGGGLGGDCCG